MAKSVTEFWQRWHITLTRWFTDYVYFPIIQKNLRSNTRRNIAVFLTMGLIGLWHGADWTFIIFGVFHGFLIVLERTPLTNDRKSSVFHKALIPNFIVPFLSFLFITVSSILFRSQNIEEVWIIFKRISSFIPNENIGPLINKRFLVFVFIMILSEIYTRSL